MKTALSISAVLMATAINASALENSLSTKSETPAPVASASPKYSFGYSYYHYSMEGTTTANTKIYKFGDANVDVQLYSLTYNLNPKWTLTALVPYIRNRVETIYEPVPGGLNLSLTDFNEGLGDVRLMAMRPIFSSPSYISLVDVGMTAPTGSIDNNFTSNPTQRVSYNMQLGSGTPDLYLGLTQLFITTPKWMQTARLQYAERLGRNYHGWALGNELQASAASKYQLVSWLNVGAQANLKYRGAVRGRDNRYEIFNNYQSTNARGDGHQYYHGPQTTYDLSLIVKAEKKISYVTGALELGVPAWQDANNKDGIRLDTRYYLSGSASASF